MSDGDVDLARRVARLERRNRQLTRRVGVLERRGQVLAFRAAVARWEHERTRSRRSVRLAAALGAARRSPRRLVALPLTVLRILTRPQPVGPRPTLPEVRPAPSPEPAPSKAAAQPPEPDPAMRPPDLVEEPVPAGPVRRSELRVAAILDEFSRVAWQYEADLHHLRPESWRETVEAVRPHLLFVESAWRGVDDLWRHKIANTQGPGTELEELVAWCRGQGVPTVFWNKEDPPNYAEFVHSAALFDQVLTVDEGSIERYRRDLGHDRIGVLPFAAQPRIHNPIRHQLEAHDHAVAFAGTYIAHKHPHRKVQIAQVLDPARAHGLHIFSRRDTGRNYRFPAPLDRHVVGTLTYAETLAAYKRYKLFLNVNSVVKSPTMCARRIFELLACGSTVLSGASPAITALLGDGLVFETADPDDTDELLGRLLADDDLRERTAVRGLRRVLREHTYTQRFEQVLSVAGLAAAGRPEPSGVSAVVTVDESSAAEPVVGLLAAQDHAPFELVLVGHDEEALAGLADLARQAGARTVRTVHARGNDRLAAGIATAANELVLMADDPTAVYAHHAVTDLVQAFAYTDAEVVGKRTHTALLDTTVEGARVLDPGHEYRYVSHLAPGSMLFRADALPQDLDGVGDATTLLQAVQDAGGTCFATDRFGFARLHEEAVHPVTAGQLELITVADKAPAPSRSGA